jgi:hypothetical protein
MYGIDVAATQCMNGWAGRNPTFDFLMIWVSAAGVPLLVLAVAGQWWLPADKPHKRHVLLAAGFSFLLGLAINQLVLLFIHRVRPSDSGVTNLLIARSGGQFGFNFSSCLLRDSKSSYICNSGRALRPRRARPANNSFTKF